MMLRRFGNYTPLAASPRRPLPPPSDDGPLMFTTRRHLPVTPPSAKAPKGFAWDTARAAWHRGFLCGVVASVGGLCLFVAVIRVLA